jgi:hypothetical protein
MGTALEKRVRKLEKSIPSPPCDKPGHGPMFVWIDDNSEAAAENERLAKEIQECPNCKDKTLIRFIRWRKDGEEEPVSSATGITIHFGVETKPEPQGDSLAIPDWLKDLEDE